MYSLLTLEQTWTSELGRASSEFWLGTRETATVPVASEVHTCQKRPIIYHKRDLLFIYNMYIIYIYNMYIPQRRQTHTGKPKTHSSVSQTPRTLVARGLSYHERDLHLSQEAYHITKETYACRKRPIISRKRPIIQV